MEFFLKIFLALVAVYCVMTALRFFIPLVFPPAPQKTVLFRIRPNKLSERNPAVAEQIFSAIHGIFRKQTFLQKLKKEKEPWFSLEIANTSGHIYFYIRTLQKHANFIKGQFHAQYPESEIEEMEEDFVEEMGKEKNILWTELEFLKSDIWPIKRHSQFEDRTAGTLNDPIAGVLDPFSTLDENMGLHVQICCQPIDAEEFRSLGISYVKMAKNSMSSTGGMKNLFDRLCMEMNGRKRFFQRPLLFLLKILLMARGSDFAEDENAPILEMSKSHERENRMSAATDKISKIPFFTAIRVGCSHIPAQHFEAETKLNEVSGAFGQFHLPQLNGFSAGKYQKNTRFYHKRITEGTIHKQMVLNNEELATLFHMPNKTVSVPHIDWVSSRTFEAPQNLPLSEKEEAITTLGVTNFRSTKKQFGIREDDRRRHIYIAGKTGMGKSTLLENMIFSDIAAGKGVAVVDPHGDLAEAVLDFVPKSRTNDVVLFDPSDAEFPVSFNMLECKNPAHRHLVASGVVGVFKKMFAESWGPRLEHILRNTLLALIEAQGTSMLGVMRMLADDSYRKEIVGQVADPMVQSFWRDEFGKWNAKQIAEAVSPIQNKVGQFLSSSLIRNILGQTKSSIDLRFFMDKGKIIIINLSKGKIGEDNSALLGSMLVTKFQLDVMSRADIPEKERKDFYLYVDEFQNFATDSFATILSEARKYRLNLTVANQYLAQMSDEVREAIFGNVGTMVTFQVGFDDADALMNQFGGEEVIEAADIGALPKYQVYLRLMIDGMPSSVFSSNTLPPPDFEIDEERREKIRNVCRQRYGRPRAKVEANIQKWAWK